MLEGREVKKEEKIRELLAKRNDKEGIKELKQFIDGCSYIPQENSAHLKYNDIKVYSELVYIAIQEEARDILSYMVAKYPTGADISEMGFKPYMENLKHAIQQGNTRILDIILNQGPYIITSDKYLNLIIESITQDKYEMFKFLFTNNPFSLNTEQYIQLLQWSLQNEGIIFFREILSKIPKTLIVEVMKHSKYKELIDNCIIKDKSQQVEILSKIDSSILSGEKYMDWLRKCIVESKNRTFELFIKNYFLKISPEEYRELLQLTAKYERIDFFKYIVGRLPEKNKTKQLSVCLESVIGEASASFVNALLSLDDKLIIDNHNYIDYINSAISKKNDELLYVLIRRFKVIKSAVVKDKLINSKYIATFLRNAVEGKCIKCIQVLVENYPSIISNEEYNKCIIDSYQKKDFETFEFLLIKKSIQSFKNYSADYDICRINDYIGDIKEKVRAIKNNFENQDIIDHIINTDFSEKIIQQFNYELLYKLKILTDECGEYPLHQDTKQHILPCNMPDHKNDLTQIKLQDINMQISKLAVIQEFNRFRKIIKNPTEKLDFKAIEFQRIYKKFPNCLPGFIQTLKDVKGYTLLMTAAKAVNVQAIEEFLPYCNTNNILEAFKIVINISINQNKFEVDTENRILTILSMTKEKLSSYDIEKAIQKVSLSSDRQLKEKVLNILNQKELYRNETLSTDIKNDSIQLKEILDNAARVDVTSKAKDYIKSDKYELFIGLIQENINAYDHLELIKLTCEYGRTLYLRKMIIVDPNILTEKEIVDCLEIALVKGHIDIINILLSMNSSLIINNDSYSIYIRKAIVNNDAELVELLIKAIKNTKDKTTIKNLLQEGFILNLMDLAIQYGHHKVIKVLIDQDPNIIKSSRYIKYLNHAIISNNREAFDVLTKSIIQTKDENIIGSLLTYKNISEWLNTSIIYDYQEIMKVIIKSDYNIITQVVDENSYTDLAFTLKSFEIFNYLIANKIMRKFKESPKDFQDIYDDLLEDKELKYNRGVKDYLLNEVNKTNILLQVNKEFTIYKLQLLASEYDAYGLHETCTERREIEHIKKLNLFIMNPNYLEQKMDNLHIILDFYELIKLIKKDGYIPSKINKLQEDKRQYLLNLKDLRGNTLLMIATKHMNCTAVHDFLNYYDNLSDAFMIAIMKIPTKKIDQPNLVNRTLFNLFTFKRYQPDIVSPIDECRIREIIRLMLPKATEKDIESAMIKLLKLEKSPLKLRQEILQILVREYKGEMKEEIQKFIDIPRSGENNGMKLEDGRISASRKNVLDKLEQIRSKNSLCQPEIKRINVEVPEKKVVNH